jgi:cryptochrome
VFASHALILDIKPKIMQSSCEKVNVALHWFRKGLRLHDNPALVHAFRNARTVYPVFCIDPHFARPEYVGVNRYNFMLECISDLDSQLRKLGSRLFVLQGNPETKIPEAVETWGVDLITFESDSEPYAIRRDRSICDHLRTRRGVTIKTFPTHVLHDLEQYIAASKGSVPSTYIAFEKLFNSLGRVREPLSSPTNTDVVPLPSDILASSTFSIPSLVDMGYSEIPTTTFKGGETEALKRLEDYVITRTDWVKNFSKPDTAPNSLNPSTTVTFDYSKLSDCYQLIHYHVLSRYFPHI